MEITLENVRSRLDPKTRPPFNIFLKIKRPHEFKLPVEQPFFECILFKKQKILKKEKPGKYQFFDEKCLYFDLSKKPVLKSIFFFNFNAKLEFIKRVDNDKKKINLENIGIRISKEGFEKELYSNEKNGAEKVMKFLRKRIFQTNFHQNYKALKQLGRGNFATVGILLKMLDKLRIFAGL